MNFFLKDAIRLMPWMDGIDVGMGRYHGATGEAGEGGHSALSNDQIYLIFRCEQSASPSRPL